MTEILRGLWNAGVQNGVQSSVGKEEQEESLGWKWPSLYLQQGTECPLLLHKTRSSLTQQCLPASWGLRVFHLFKLGAFFFSPSLRRIILWFQRSYSSCEQFQMVVESVWLFLQMVISGRINHSEVCLRRGFVWFLVLHQSFMKWNFCSAPVTKPMMAETTSWGSTGHTLLLCGCWCSLWHGDREEGEQHWFN